MVEVALQTKLIIGIITLVVFYFLIDIGHSWVGLTLIATSLPIQL